MESRLDTSDNPRADVRDGLLASLGDRVAADHELRIGHAVENALGVTVRGIDDENIDAGSDQRAPDVAGDEPEHGAGRRSETPDAKVRIEKDRRDLRAVEQILQVAVVADVDRRAAVLAAQGQALDQAHDHQQRRRQR